MSRKQKNREQEKRVSRTEEIMRRYPEPESMIGIVKAARPLVEYHDQGDGTMVAWCPAVILVQLNPETRTVKHLFAHTETPPPKGYEHLAKPEPPQPTRPRILETP